MTDYGGIRRRLEERRRELRSQLARIEGNLRQVAHPDSEERATEKENDEVLEELDARGLADLDGIDAALARMDDGSYGRCHRCDGRILKARLEALPFATLCIRCARE